MYGDHNSILLDNNQISMNTEYFHMNNKSLVNFNNLSLFKFDDRRARIHVDRINSEYVLKEVWCLFLIEFFSLDPW